MPRFLRCESEAVPSKEAYKLKRQTWCKNLLNRFRIFEKL